MSAGGRWAALAGMFGVMVVLFLFNPQLAVSIGLVVLLIGLGWGYRNGKFSL